MNGDGTVYQRVPSADQLATPGLQGPAFVELGGSLIGVVLALVGHPRAAIIVASAAMLSLGIATLVRHGRIVRDLQGGDEGALPAGAVSQVVGPVAAIALAIVGLTGAAATAFAGTAMLATTAQGLMTGPPGVRARYAGAALLLASVGFALGLVSLVDTHRWTLVLSLVTSFGAAAIGALGLTTNEMMARRTSRTGVLPRTA